MGVMDRTKQASEAFTFVPVGLHPCTESDKEVYFPDLEPTLEEIFETMFCIDDPSSITLYGNIYN